MKTRIIIRSGKIKPLLEIDGKMITSNCDKQGNHIFEVFTDLDNVNIRIYSMNHELKEKYWWIFTFLFYLVSIFGIFNTKYSKNYYYFDYNGILDTKVELLDLSLNQVGENNMALICNSGKFMNNETNIYKFDLELKKRRKLLSILKVLSWIFIVLVVVVVMLFR